MADEQWVTWAEAAVIVGCSEPTIHRAVRRGAIERRSDRSRHTPSLSRVSVDAYAERWGAQERARSERRATPPTPVSRPPEDGHVWLDAVAAGLILGVSRSQVQKLVGRGDLPHERRGYRIWLRHDQIEQFAAERR